MAVDDWGRSLMTENPNISELLEFTTEIVAAHAGNNAVSAEDLPQLIEEVYKALSCLGSSTPKTARLKPAVALKKSIFPDYIICLEDGKKLKMLKRHLKTSYNMTPEEYRERWGLAPDYPMVAPNYAKHRSNLAKKIGLGTGSRRKRK